MLEFEWNKEKAELNLTKRKISFEEAKTAFYDKSGIFYFDKKHSQDEKRYNLIGKTVSNKMVTISFTIRGYNYRIISCRHANKKEKSKYEERNKIY